MVKLALRKLLFLTVSGVLVFLIYFIGIFLLSLVQFLDYPLLRLLLILAPTLFFLLRYVIRKRVENRENREAFLSALPAGAGYFKAALGYTVKFRELWVEVTLSLIPSLLMVILLAATTDAPLSAELPAALCVLLMNAVLAFLFLLTLWMIVAFYWYRERPSESHET